MGFISEKNLVLFTFLPFNFPSLQNFFFFDQKMRCGCLSIALQKPTDKKRVACLFSDEDLFGYDHAEGVDSEAALPQA